MSENKITFPAKLSSNNPQSFGIVDATETSGHRSVDTISELYAISDSILSILKDGSDAIGQEWFVVSEDCKYRLDNWENRKSVTGWTKLPKQELINTKQYISEKDQPNGYAGLDSNGKIPIEKTYGTTATVVDVETYESLPVTGLSGVIYYVSNTSAQYKWSGSAYIDITDGADNAKKNETSIFDCSNGTSTKYYSSLSAAINVVPPVYRTSNRIISYLSTENATTTAVNYQYHGIDSTTWTDLTKWERIPNQADLAEIRSDLSETSNYIDNLLNQGYLYCGIATPSASPVTNLSKIFYLAKSAGTYANFGNLAIYNDSLAVFTKDGIGSWSKIQITPEYSNILIDAFVDGWTGGDKKLFINLIYRNNPTYKSGIRVFVSDRDGANEKQAAYWSQLSGIKSGIEQLTPISLVDDLGTITLTVNWDAVPNQYNQSVDYIYIPKKFFKKGILIRELANQQTTLANQQTTLANQQTPFLRGGLPMILNTSSLVDEVSSGRTLKPSIMSNFLLDFKLEGTAEPDMEYILEFQYQKTGSVTYANYLAVYKKDVSNIKTLVAGLHVGMNAPIGKQLINIPIESGYTFLTKATVYLDYDALNVLEAGTSTFSKFKLDSYNFNQTYIFDLNIGPLAEKAQVQQIEDIETLANQADAKATQADAKATQANEKLSTEETTTWELDNDLTFFTSNYYGLKNLGQYTKVLTEAIAFSQVRLNLVSYSGDVQYKVCIVKGTGPLRRNCPVGPISPSTHTIIKEGILNMTTGYKDYLIDLGGFFTCPIGSQVAIYMVSVSGNQILMRGVPGGLGNPEKTSNAALYSTDANPFAGGNWKAGNVDELTNIGYYNVALSLRIVPLFVTKEELGDQVQHQVEISVPEYIKPDIKLTIPDKVYAVVGTELNLWNDAVSLSVDKGLSSPLNYQVRWYCTKGLITDRCFRFTPTDSDVGTVSCTCYIYDMRGSLIDSKTFSIIVSAKNAITAAKNIVYFGDSLGDSTAGSLFSNFNDINKFTGIIPIMRGTRGTTVKYEAVGGYGWRQYATSGNYAYRIQVTGVTSASVGATYTLNSYPNPFTIREVNIVDGTGNMLIEYQYGGQVADFPVTGTLNKVSGSGDSVINFTGGLQEPNNPLWNSSTNKLDVALYKTRIGLTVNDKIDAVSFQFGINDNGLANDLTTLMTYISDLYNAFITDNPNCKVIIGLTTSSGNDVNGAGSNYGSSYNYLRYLSNTYKIRQFYLTLQNYAQYPNIVIAPVSLSVDRYYGYDFSERAISQRYTTTEKYHNNYVHPGSSGYGQIADAYFGVYVDSLK